RPSQHGRIVPAILELSRQIAALEQLQCGVHRLASDIVTRDTFAEAFTLVGQDAANDDIVGFRPGMRSVADRPPQRDPNMKRSEFDNLHATLDYFGKASMQSQPPRMIMTTALMVGNRRMNRPLPQRDEPNPFSFTTAMPTATSVPARPMLK